MAPWIPVVVTIVLGALGLAVQGLLLAYFLGKMKEHQIGQAQLVQTFQKFTEQALSALTQRMGAVDAFTSESQADRAAITARLNNLERLTEGLPAFREEFAAFRATSEAHQHRVEAELGRILQSQESQQRQLSNLALRGTGEVMQLAPAKGV